MNMQSALNLRCPKLPAAIAAAALLALSTTALAEQVRVTLSGDAEVPAVDTKATGMGIINIGVDDSITGNVHTSGVAATMAHIHEGAPGKSGPVTIPLIRDGDNGWAVPPNTKLNPEQLKAFKAGDLYVNVHSAAHPAGEIRGQLKP
jgi:hypothetical protein